MAQVRFLIVGVGGMGRAHIENLLREEDALIVGLVDPSASAIETTKQRFPQLAEVAVYDDLSAALRTVQADAAVIVTPHSLHFDQGMACLDAGLHVLMEKPFVAGSARANEIIDHAVKVGRHLAVGYQRHTQGAYIYLRDLIQSGSLGQIQFITAYQAQAWLEGCRGTWRHTQAMSCGGQLNDSGSHILDVILWMTGLQPDEVKATIDNRGTEVDIDSAVTVRFEGGAICTFNIVGSATVDWWEDVSIHGTGGTALYRNGKLMVSKGFRAPFVEVPDSELPASSNPDANFIDLLLGRVEEAAAPAACGYRVARLTEAAWESAASGSPVRF